MRLRTFAVVSALVLAPIPGRADGVIYISGSVPYAEGAPVAQNIRDECRLGAQQAEFIEQFAREGGITVQRDDTAVAAGSGRILRVEITNAVSSGNAFIGHQKQVAVRGRLIENGAEVGDFTGVRSSMGGAFGGYKGSCAVLGRCVQALGKDIAGWLKAPGRGSRIGE
jgi:hypothetical protein